MGALKGIVSVFQFSHVLTNRHCPLLDNLIIRLEGKSPPIHQNCFKKVALYEKQAEYFKDFVIANSIPSGRSFRGRTHYLLPSIRRAKISARPKENSSLAHFTMLRDESLTHFFVVLCERFIHHFQLCVSSSRRFFQLSVSRRLNATIVTHAMSLNTR